MKIDPRLRQELAPTGRLRVAINYGNPVLAQRSQPAGQPEGVSVDLAVEVGRRLGVPVEFSTPNFAYSAPPISSTGVTVVIDSTLFTAVGEA